MFADVSISDAVWLALIGVLTIIVKEYFDRQRAKDAAAVAQQAKDDAAKAQQSATAAAVNAIEVKKTLADTTADTTEKLDGLAKVATATHTLVNSSMSAQLKISAVALRRVAELTKHPDDIAAAELAEKLLHEQETKQAVVDAKDCPAEIKNAEDESEGKTP